MKTVRDLKALQRMAFKTGARVRVADETINAAGVQADPEPPAQPPPPLPPPAPAPAPVPMQDIMAAAMQQQTHAMTSVVGEVGRLIAEAIRPPPLTIMGQPAPPQAPKPPKSYHLSVNTSPVDGLILEATLICDGVPSWSFVPVRDDSDNPQSVSIVPLGNHQPGVSNGYPS